MPSTALLKPLANLVRGRPILAVFELNLACNSACRYCDLPLNLGRPELSRRQIRTMFEHLYAEGIRLVFLQGGEPTLRHDLLEVIGDLVDIGLSTTLITNGTRLRPVLVQGLEQLGVSISVSLDTLNRERYQKIRGADQLRLVLRGIDNLKDYVHPKYLTCIVSEVNRTEVATVAQFATDNGFVPVIGAYHWDVGRYGKEDAEIQYRKAVVADVFAELLRERAVPTGYFSQYLRDNIDWLNDRGLPRCDAGRYSIAIDASGNVAPCLATPHAGNLLEHPLSTILATLDHEAVKRCSDATSCNMMCSRVVGSLMRRPWQVVSV